MSFVLRRPDGGYYSEDDVKSAVSAFGILPNALSMGRIVKAVFSLLKQGRSFASAVDFAVESEGYDSVGESGETTVEAVEERDIESWRTEVGSYGIGKGDFKEGSYFGDVIGARTWETKAGYEYCLFPKKGFRKSKFRTKHKHVLYYRPKAGWRSERETEETEGLPSGMGLSRAEERYEEYEAAQQGLAYPREFLDWLNFAGMKGQESEEMYEQWKEYKKYVSSVLDVGSH